jgi:hypothetical protein
MSVDPTAWMTPDISPWWLLGMLLGGVCVSMAINWRRRG